MSDVNEFSDLMGTGYQGGKEQIAPEDEFFHSAYISGKTRTNHINVTEQSGKLQIRGVQYNLDEINMIITHTKEILANIETKNKKDTIKCFSYKDGAPPWFGTSALGDGSNRQCPQTSAERAVNDFCTKCRAQILVAGVYCKEDGTPILTDDNKPIFIFLRGKGMRYNNVSTYLNELYKEDLTPIFEPATEQSKEFEKSVVNNKRFVTKITQGVETSQYDNDVNVFVLSKGMEIPKESVLSILKLSKQTLAKFNDKFDWSKGKQTTGYAPPAEGVLPVDGSESTQPKEEEKAKEAGTTGKTFSFDDIEF